MTKNKKKNGKGINRTNKIIISLTILAIILVSFSFTLKPKQQITGNVVLPNHGCCDLTCTETSFTDCPSNFFHDQESCFDLDECNIGCCIDDEGYCYTNYAKNYCDREGNDFIQGRECQQYRECLVAPPWPADQGGYMFVDTDGVLSITPTPFSGKINDLFKIESNLMKEQDHVQVRLTTRYYNDTFRIYDFGLNEDNYANDLTYSGTWDSSDHPMIWKMERVKIQTLINNEPKGNPNVFFLSPTSCIPSSPFWNSSKNRTNIIFAKKSNLDYVNINEKSLGLMSNLLRNNSALLFDYEIYHYLDAVDTQPVSFYEGQCKFTMENNDLIIILDEDEDFCHQEGNIVTTSSTFVPKRETTIIDSSFTKNFCDYIETPVDRSKDYFQTRIKPIVEIISPFNGEKINTPNFDLVINASDNQSKILRYKVYLDEDSNNLAWGYMPANNTLTIPTPLEDGIHELYIKLEDLDGNLHHDSKTIEVNVSDFTITSTLEQEMISLPEFNFRIFVNHNDESNLTYVVYDGKQSIQIGNVETNSSKMIKVNLTKGTHDIKTVLYDSNSRKASTPTSEVEVFEVPQGITAPPQRLEIELNFTDIVGRENNTPDSIFYQAYITKIPFTKNLDECSLDNDRDIIDEVCLDQIIVNRNNIQLKLKYDQGGDSYVKNVNVKVKLAGNNYTKEKDFPTPAKDKSENGEIEVDLTFLSVPSLHALTGAFTSITGFATVTTPWGNVDTDTGEDRDGNDYDINEDGSVIGPDGYTYYSIDENMLHEPQKLCGGLLDLGVRFRPESCMDSFTTDIIGNAGSKTFEGGIYKYQYDYDIFSCNEDVFVDVYFRNRFVSGSGLIDSNVVNFTTTKDLVQIRYQTCPSDYGVEYQTKEGFNFCILPEFVPYFQITNECPINFVNKGDVDNKSLCVQRSVTTFIPKLGDVCESGYVSAGNYDGDSFMCIKDESSQQVEISQMSFTGQDILIEELHSTILSTGYRLTDNDIYESSLSFNEFCIYVSDESVDNQPLCFQFGQTKCSNQIDDDGDDLIDLDDPGCEDAWDDDEYPETSECQDGIDNDGDGSCDVNGCTIDGIDLPGDPGCSRNTDNNEAAATTQCQDGLDNDNDLLIDLDDPGCTNSQDDREDDGTSQCQDGIDNDNDNQCDYNGCNGLPPDQACFTDLSCYPTCANQTINTEIVEVPPCITSDETVIRIKNIGVTTSGDDFVYDINYDAYACRLNLYFEIYLINQTDRLNIIEGDDGILLSGQNTIDSKTIALPTNYSEICISTTDTTFGDSGTVCQQIYN